MRVGAGVAGGCGRGPGELRARYKQAASSGGVAMVVAAR